MRWLPIVLIIFALAAFYLFGYHNYLTFENLKFHREILLAWTESHYLISVFVYCFTYIFAVAISIPGAVFLTLIGGFLFGPLWGTLFVVISATLGALIVFSAIRLAFEPLALKYAAEWVNKMRDGFQKGAAQYLLILRLIPLFPFWAVNITAALLGVPVMIFAITTLAGIIPGTYIYVLLGSGLGTLFDRNQSPNLQIIYEPAILMPLIGLALLSLLPSLYQWMKRKNKRGNTSM